MRCLVPIKDAADKVNILIEGDPVNAREPNPDYDDYKGVGDTISGSFPSDSVDGHDWYKGVGCRLDTQDDEGHWILGTPQNELSINYTPDEDGNFRLTWLWSLYGYRVAVGYVQWPTWICCRNGRRAR